MGLNGKHGLSRCALIAASALDVSMRADIAASLERLRGRLRLMMPSIAHDLHFAVARRRQAFEQGRMAEGTAGPRDEYAHAAPVLAGAA